MKISPTQSQTWLRATGLWSDVSLLVVGEQRSPSDPNPTLVKLGEFAAKGPAHDKAVAPGALAEAGAFKYVALRFLCQTFQSSPAASARTAVSQSRSLISSWIMCRPK
jgi:hypothetical protein